MVLAPLYIASSLAFSGYRILKSSRPLQALAFGIGYSAGTRIGYNALGFLQVPRLGRFRTLKYTSWRPLRRMPYVWVPRYGRGRRRSYGRRRRHGYRRRGYRGRY